MGGNGGLSSCLGAGGGGGGSLSLFMSNTKLNVSLPSRLNGAVGCSSSLAICGLGFSATGASFFGASFACCVFLSKGKHTLGRCCSSSNSCLVLKLEGLSVMLKLYPRLSSLQLTQITS